jgi:hypothetical protein
VQIALYIALAALVVAAVAMQVWLMRSAGPSLPESRRGLAAGLRLVNIALILVAAGLVAYVLWGR